MQPDVIVIGAGAAGLAAAEALSAAGIKTLVLEARGRVGGRIHTLRESGFPLELGAEFVHGCPPEILDLADAAELRLRKLAGQNWRTDENGEIVSEAEDSIEEAIWQKLESFSGSDVSFAEFLETNFAAPEFEQARRSARRYVEGFHAADADDASVSGLRKTERVTGGEDCRFIDGYDRFVQILCERALGSGAEICLNEKVETIRWSKNKIEIEPAGRAGTYSARYAVFTLPLGVWQAGNIRFEPSLPVEKEAALQKMKMGAVVRVSIRFRRNWWAEILRPKGSESLGFLFSNDAEIPVWWTSEPIEANILTGWVGGTRAERLCGHGSGQIISAATESLARIFKRKREFVENEIEKAVTHDWQSDELTLGGYSYILTGGAQAPEILARPVEETLFFAGEATNTEGHWATVHGAVSTGRRAAREIIGSLQ